MSPDGQSVYAVGPWFNGMVEHLTRTTAAGANHGDIVHTAFFQGPSATRETLGNSPTDIKVTPDGKQVFIATGNNSGVLGWSRATSGALTPSTGSARCVGAGTGSPAGSCQSRASINTTVRLK